MASRDAGGWGFLGDQLSVIRVLDATGPETPPDYKNSGGLIGRSVAAKVERTLWRRPCASRVTGVVRFRAWGWMMETDQDAESPRRPIVAESAPRLEIGRRYLAVLVRDDGEWFPLTDEAVMTLAPDDTVTSEVISGRPVTAAAALRGKSLEQAARIVAGTPPHPVARQNCRLPPRARSEKVSRAGG